MANFRQERINSEMARELAVAIQNVKDPRISSYFVSITGVDCAKDLKTAKVYFSFLSSNGDANEIKKILDGAANYLRSHLASTINLRETPRLSFHYDNSIERGNRISQVLHELTSKNKNDKDPKEK